VARGSDNSTAIALFALLIVGITIVFKAPANSVQAWLTKANLSGPADTAAGKAVSGLGSLMNSIVARFTTHSMQPTAAQYRATSGGNPPPPPELDPFGNPYAAWDSVLTGDEGGSGGIS
jgi:hypothetical protein